MGARERAKKIAGWFTDSTSLLGGVSIFLTAITALYDELSDGDKEHAQAFIEGTLKYLKERDDLIKQSRSLWRSPEGGQ